MRVRHARDSRKEFLNLRRAAVTRRLGGECKHCDKPARRGGLCDVHDKRRVRRTPMSAPVVQRHEGPLERLAEAALAYADADAEDEGAFSRAKDRLRKSAIHYSECLPRQHVASPRRRMSNVKQMELWERE